jgi:hypothetical protein
MPNGVTNLERIVATTRTDREHGPGFSTSRLSRMIGRVIVVEMGRDLGQRPGVEREPGAALKLWCR